MLVVQDICLKIKKKFNFIENNILIMSNVFNLIKKYNKRFIFASSQMSNMHYSKLWSLKKLVKFIVKV